MIKSKAFKHVLEQFNTGGNTYTMLLDSEGSLLADSSVGDQDPGVIAAIASSVWQTYKKNSKSAFGDEGALKMVLLNCEKGRVVIGDVAGFLLCMYANNDVDLGILKKKATMLIQHFEGPLAQANENC